MFLSSAPSVRAITRYRLQAANSSSILRKTPAITFACLILFGSGLPTADARASQTYRGAIIGTVTDVNGGAIPDAAVRARNISTGLERATITDSAGNYAIPELPIGAYEVTVTKTNFTLAIVTSVWVVIAGERRADVMMEVVGGSERVEIQANAVAEWLALQIPREDWPGIFGAVIPVPVEPDWDSLFEANREANLEEDAREAGLQLGAQDVAPPCLLDMAE